LLVEGSFPANPTIGLSVDQISVLQNNNTKGIFEKKCYKLKLQEDKDSRMQTRRNSSVSNKMTEGLLGCLEIIRRNSEGGIAMFLIGILD